ERAGRRNELLMLYVRCARLRPNDFRSNVEAGLSLVALSTIEEAKPFVERAVSLMPSAVADDAPETALDIAWVKTLPVFDLWTQGRPREAADLLDQLVSHQPIDEALAEFAGTINLSLGRVRAAEDAFRAMSALGRLAPLAVAALARGDVERARHT